MLLPLSLRHNLKIYLMRCNSFKRCYFYTKLNQIKIIIKIKFIIHLYITAKIIQIYQCSRGTRNNVYNK